jgi:CBS domain-containing protein
VISITYSWGIPAQLNLPTKNESLKSWPDSDVHHCTEMMVRGCCGRSEYWFCNLRRCNVRVIELMTGTPAYCRSDTNLGAAVELMWNYNCGFLPVINAEEKVIGVITDRDICIALGTRVKLAGDILVSEVASPKVLCCQPEDDVRTVLTTMAEARVRRLPVVNGGGKLVGILSMDDVVTHMQFGRRTRTVELSSDDLVRILNLVYRPHLPAVVH